MNECEKTLARIEQSLTTLFNPNQGTKLVDAYIPLVNDFASGNEVGKGAMYRTKKGNLAQNTFRPKSYTDYQKEVAQALIDLYGDANETVYDLKEIVGVSGLIPELRELHVNIIFFYDDGNITKRSTKDLDNTSKSTLDAMQKALNFDDAQITKLTLEKRISTQKALAVQIWVQ